MEDVEKTENNVDNIENKENTMPEVANSAMAIMARDPDTAKRRLAFQKSYSLEVGHKICFHIFSYTFITVLILKVLSNINISAL